MKCQKSTNYKLNLLKSQKITVKSIFDYTLTTTIISCLNTASVCSLNLICHDPDKCIPFHTHQL